jgi:CHAD domain-containing protein
VETFELLQPGDGELDVRPVTSIRRALAEDVNAARSEVVRWHVVGNTIDALAAARPRVATWPLEHDDWEAVGPGLRRVYRQGRNRMADAAAAGTAEARHEWRKRAKYLWYQLRILEPAWPAALSGMVGEADRLSDLLGEEHDLAVLRARLGSLTAGAEGAAIDELCARIDRRAKGLQTQAFSLGQRLYAERPGDFTARVGAYFAAWRSDPTSLA